jgi:hypothetical protein
MVDSRLCTHVGHVGSSMTGFFYASSAPNLAGASLCLNSGGAGSNARLGEEGLCLSYADRACFGMCYLGGARLNASRSGASLY